MMAVLTMQLILMLKNLKSDSREIPRLAIRIHTADAVTHQAASWKE